MIAIDLAPAWSAAVCIEWDAPETVRPTHAWDVVKLGDMDGFLSYTADRILSDRPDYVVVEDIPHGMGYRRTLKDQLRAQGRLIELLRDPAIGAIDIYFVSPASWQREAGVFRQNAKAWKETSQAVASQLGWSPEHDPDALKGKAKQDARKQNGDGADAFLMAWSAVQWLESPDRLALSGIEQYRHA